MPGVSELRDDLGSIVDVEVAPRRIVSLVPSLTETLWLWGLGPRLVGVTDYCVSPPGGLAGARRLRGTKNPDLRALIALEPDLVVANEEENRELDVRRLREAGLAVHVTRVRTLEDIQASLGRLARVLGLPDDGGIGAALQAARRRVVAPDPAVVACCPIWRDGGTHAGTPEERWWTVGPDTVVGALLRAAGFTLWPQAGRYPQVTTAALQAAGPEVVLLPSEPYAFSPLDHPPLAGSGALLRHVDGQALLWWGPRTPGALTDLASMARDVRGQLGAHA